MCDPNSFASFDFGPLEPPSQDACDEVTWTVVEASSGPTLGDQRPFGAMVRFTPVISGIDPGWRFGPPPEVGGPDCEDL